MVIFVKIDVVKVGYLRCNCYILSMDDKVIVIDPGDEYDKISPYLKGKVVLGVMLTHRHFDHIGALKNIVDDYKCDIYDYSSLEEKKYDIDGFSFEVIKVPGHTLDCLCYYFKNDNIMFTGDFLFKGTVGRCDLPESDYEMMVKSINKIKKYSDNIIIYPGHGDSSNLGDEKKFNPYFK